MSTLTEQRVFKNNGKRFEEDFKASLSPHIWSYRPPDTGGGLLARFTSESLADLFTFNTNTNELSIVELKSTLGTSVSFRPHQQCIQYEKAKKEFEDWNAGLTPLARKTNKEEIKNKKKELKEMYKATNQSMIKYHQIKSLKEIHDDYDGKIKTYIAFTFFRSNDTFILPIEHFYDFWLTTNKKSINVNDLNDLVAKNKCYKVNQEFIRKTMKSKYDLSTALG